MAEKTTSKQLEELNEEIKQKYEELDGLSTGTGEPSASSDELDAYIMCLRELDVLLRERCLLTERMLHIRSRYHS